MKKQPVWMEYVWITLGAIFIAFPIKNIYAPVNLVTGGVSGLAIIFNKMFGVPLWATTAAINAILFLVSLKLLGWNYVKRTAYTMAALSASLAWIPSVPMFNGDMIISAIFGGICTGIGVALTIRNGTSTGGTDMLAWLIRLKLKSRSVVEIMQFLDAAVVLAGIYVFGIQPAMYALITVYTVTKVSDSLIEGVNFSKQIFVISDKSEEIAQAVMQELDRGVTAIQATGMYSKTNKQMHSVIYRRQLLLDCGLEMPKHTFYVDNIFVYQPLPHVRTLYYLDVNFYRYFIGRGDQSVNEAVMIGRIDQQLKVTRLMLSYYDPYKIENRRLRQYMILYLEIMMVVCSILAIKSGEKDNMLKKKEIWYHLKNLNFRLFMRIRWGFLGQSMNLPGKAGRQVSILGYKITQKFYGFN